MGDINLDWAKWNSHDYPLKSLVDQVKLFMADTATCQTLKSLTRFGLVGALLTWSSIDHCYTTNSDIFTTPVTHSAG